MRLIGGFLVLVLTLVTGCAAGDVAEDEPAVVEHSADAGVAVPEASTDDAAWPVDRPSCLSQLSCVCENDGDRKIAHAAAMQWYCDWSTWDKVCVEVFDCNKAPTL